MKRQKLDLRVIPLAALIGMLCSLAVPGAVYLLGGQSTGEESPFEILSVAFFLILYVSTFFLILYVSTVSFCIGMEWLVKRIPPNWYIIEFGRHEEALPRAEVRK